MDLTGFLEERSQAIVDEATGAIGRVHIPHYQVGSETRERFETLMRALVDSLSKRDLTSIVTHAHDIAEKRFDAGFDLSEVQTAFNVLEEITWKRILSEVEPSEQAQALGLVSTALGAGKDALARTYVSCATHAHAPSLDLGRLFAGI